MDRYVSTEYGYCYYDIESYEYPLIYNLFVHPEFRNQGKSKQLLALVISSIRGTGSTLPITISAVPFDSCDVDRTKLESMYVGLGLIVLSKEVQ